MPTVDIKHVSPRSAEKLWTALVDIEEYPSYMDDVREVVVLSDAGGRRVSKWTTLLKGSEMGWTEEEHIDNDNKVLRFEQLEGDLGRYVGQWKVSDSGEGSVIEMHVEFEIGLPGLASMLNPIATTALEDNLRTILKHVEERAAG